MELEINLRKLMLAGQMGMAFSAGTVFSFPD
jgi:hypothetical protein